MIGSVRELELVIAYRDPVLAFNAVFEQVMIFRIRVQPVKKRHDAIRIGRPAPA